MFREVATVVVIYGPDQANVEATQEHSLPRELNSPGRLNFIEQDKIGAGVRPNVASVSLVAPSSMPIKYHRSHSLYFDLVDFEARYAICIKQAAQLQFGKRSGDRLTSSSKAFRKGPGAQQPSAQRQTYAPFTNTRTQAVLAAAAPTAAPPTTARRVVRRATPATLTGVAGRPTLACAVSTDSEGPLFFDHSTDPNVPHTRTAAAKNARLALIFVIETSIVARQRCFLRLAAG
jgi:hypothetical protein